MSSDFDRARCYPIVDEARCTGCSLCVAACPCAAVTMEEGHPLFRCGAYCHLRPDCVVLKHCFWPCEDACPTGAISCPFGIVGKVD